MESLYNMSYKYHNVNRKKLIVYPQISTNLFSVRMGGCKFYSGTKVCLGNANTSPF